MVALGKRPSSKRVTIHVDEARALASAVMMVMTHLPPCDCVTDDLDAAMCRILSAFDMHVHVTKNEVRIGGKVMLQISDKEGE